MKKIPKKQLLESINDDVSYEFSCLMVDIPEPFSSYITRWSKISIKEDDLYYDTDSYISGFETEPHVTIKYGIEDYDHACVDHVTSRYKNVRLILGKVNKFESGDYDVLYLEVLSDDLINMNSEISDTVECVDTFPEYVPHCTIAYVKKGSCDDLLGKDFFNGFEIYCDKLSFSSLTGENIIIGL
jgi:hypothetical protein